MTDEQIANLGADKGEDGDTGEVSYLVRPAHLKRLLEERKRLLTALREARPMLGAAAVERALHGRADHSRSIMAAEQNALTAIAYAEEEAK